MFDCFKGKQRKKPKKKPELPKEPLWLRIAREEIGEKEIYGDIHNARILEYLATIKSNLVEDEVPWCAAFVNWCLSNAGLECTGSGLARSYLNYGTDVKENEICPGDILIFERGGRKSWKGHVTFYVGEGTWVYYCLGGNQDDSVSIRSYSKHRLLGIKRPL